MPFCTRCGNQISDQAIYCTSCGAEVKASPSQQPPSAYFRAPPSGGAPLYQSTGYQPPPAPGTPSYPDVPPTGEAPYSPPPPAKKSKKGCVIALVITLVVILVGAGLAVALGFWVFKADKEPVEPVETVESGETAKIVETVNKFMEALNKGDTDTAWNMLYSNSPFRWYYSMSKEQFDAYVVKPCINYFSSWNAYDCSVSEDTANVKTKMTPRTGDQYEMTIILNKQDGDWKVFDMLYDYEMERRKGHTL